MTAFERTFPPEPGQLPGARAALRAWLDHAGVAGEDAISDVLVVSSELVTNGVLHDGGGMITLRVEMREGDVCLEVTTVDHLPGRRPTYRDVEESADGGRGLDVVHALSRGYAIVRSDQERVTRCKITTSE